MSVKKIKNGGRIPKVQGHSEEGKGEVSKTTSERGRYPIISFISIGLGKIEWNKC